LVSRDEGFGFSYVEAGVFGCPSILADRPIFHEIARDTALFVDPDRPEAVAGAIQTLFTQPDVRAELSLKALGQAHLYSPENFLSHLMQIVYPY
jgi:glycosyltransferase involved in cell wall biosynthesis